MKGTNSHRFHYRFRGFHWEYGAGSSESAAAVHKTRQAMQNREALSQQQSPGKVKAQDVQENQIPG